MERVTEETDETFEYLVVLLAAYLSSGNSRLSPDLGSGGTIS